MIRPLGPSALRIAVALLPVLAVFALVPAAIAQGPPPTGENDARWQAARRVFGMEGEAANGLFRVEFPRSDVRLRIQGQDVSPAFATTGYFGFMPERNGRVLAMGEVVMLQDEVPAVLTEARRRGVMVSALHNHLIGEEPRILYLHVMDEGSADSVATALMALVQRTAAPAGPAAKDPPQGDWSTLDGILGPHASAEGRVAEYIFPRREARRIHGLPVVSSDLLETASEVDFEDLGSGRVAVTGELYVEPREVGPVVATLGENDLGVTAIHNHMVDEEPHMYWVHFYATGVPDALARGVQAALSQTASLTHARK